MEKGIDLETLGEDALRHRARGSISESKGKDWDQQAEQDRFELARVGKREVLKVGAA